MGNKRIYLIDSREDSVRSRACLSSAQHVARALETFRLLLLSPVRCQRWGVDK